MEYEDEIENRRKKEEYLTDWLQKYNQASNFIPKIEQLKETTRWEIDALSNAPKEADEVPKGGMIDFFDTDFRLLTHALPPLPEISQELFSTSEGSTTSSSAVVFENVTRVGDISTENAKAYSKLFTSKYQELQQKHGLPEEVRFLLKELGFHNTWSRFDVAEKAYYHFKIGTTAKKSAAMDMRTFLNGLEGDLFNLARKWTKENMTWDKMALRLAKGDKSNLEYSVLLHHKTIQSSLVSRLSTIGKDREGHSFTNLDFIRSGTLDHVYTILKVINR